MEEKTIRVFHETSEHFFDLMEREKCEEAWAVVLTLFEVGLVYTEPELRKLILENVERIINMVGHEYYEDGQDYLSREEEEKGEDGQT
jgi:hypothetical protein